MNSTVEIQMIPHKGALKPNEMEKLWNMYTNDGYTQAELAKKFRISQSTVSNRICRGKYRHEMKQLKELKKLSKFRLKGE